MESGSSQLQGHGPAEIIGRDEARRQSDRCEQLFNRPAACRDFRKTHENYVKKIIAAIAFMFLLASIAQAGKPQPSAQGKWVFTFTGGTTITTGAVNIVQDAHGNLNSPFFAGYVAGAWYQNYDAFSDSTCSPSGWAPVQPTGSNVNGAFNIKLQVDTGIFSALTGNAPHTGTTT